MTGEMMAWWKGEFDRFVSGEDILVPDTVLFNEDDKKDIFDQISDDMRTVKAVKVVCGEIRLRKMQLRVADIATHVSQVTRSTFCGVQYGVGGAYGAPAVS